MIVSIYRTDRATRNYGWIKRRANETLRSIFFSYAMCDCYGIPLGGVSVRIIGLDGPPTTTLKFEVILPANWDGVKVEKFLNYMRNAKNISRAVLTTSETSDTMLPCPT